MQLSEMKVGVGCQQHRNIEQVYLKRENGKNNPQNRCIKTSGKMLGAAGNKTNENKYLKQNNISLYIDKICKKKYILLPVFTNINVCWCYDSSYL